MFYIEEDKTIHLTRGDIATIVIGAVAVDGNPYTFKTGDSVRIKVYEKRGCDCVVLQKDTLIEEECQSVSIYIDKEDSKIGEVIHKPKDYWYEVELNPETAPQTIIGYDEDGAKTFRLYPEGGDRHE